MMAPMTDVFDDDDSDDDLDDDLDDDQRDLRAIAAETCAMVAASMYVSARR